MAKVQPEPLEAITELLNVISLALMVVPFIIPGTGAPHCLSVAPTLILSLLFVVLYLVDQVHDLAEQSYLVIQLICNVIAILCGLLEKGAPLALLGLLYCHLIIALAGDLFFITKERGFILLKLLKN